MNMTAFAKGILLPTLFAALGTPALADFNKAPISPECTHTPDGSDDGQAGYHIVCEPKVSGGVAGPGGLTVPRREPVQGDPDRPVVIGTLPNPDEAPDPGERASGRGQPSTSQPRQSDTEFLRSPARRVPDSPTRAQPMPETRTPASPAPASPTPESLPASRTSGARQATGGNDTRRVESERPAADGDSHGEGQR